MVEVVNYIVLAIPVFFILIGVELLVDKINNSGYYRLNDSLSNLNAGITDQITDVFSKIILIGVYAWMYDKFRFATIPQNMITWVILFIGVDFFYYWFHRYAHEINFLWGGHVVHHQSEEYNLSVALRQGAFQKFGSFAFYLPLALIGFNPIMFLIISQFQTLYQFWIHTKTIQKLPSPVEFLFNTPSHHRVHHGRNPKYIDRNHGGTLIIWDRMFGTFQEEEEEVVYGITKPLNSWNPIKAQIIFWKELISDISKTKKWRDKIHLLVNEPGWFPPELGGTKAVPEITVASAKKYNTSIPVSLSYYIFIQFVIIISITSLFLFQSDLFSTLTNILFSLLILFSITCTGGLLELRKWSFITEILRFILTPLFFYFLLSQKYLPHNLYLVLYVLSFFSLISFFIFLSFRKYFNAS